MSVKSGVESSVELWFVEIPLVYGDYVDSQKQSWKPCNDGSLQSFKQHAKEYVQSLVESLKGRFYVSVFFFNS